MASQSQAMAPWATPHSIDTADDLASAGPWTGNVLIPPSPPQSASSNAPRRIMTPRQRRLITSTSSFASFAKPSKAFASDADPAMGSTTLPDRPVQVSDLDQSEQKASWVKKPLYYTHHRKPNHEQLSQVIRLPPMYQEVQFTASEGACWDRIAENVLQASQKHPAKRLSIVVLLYCFPCNPFHMGDVGTLKRAKASLSTLKDVVVVGALVVPFSDQALKERGVPEDRRLPFTLRRDITRNVLKSAQQDDWVIVDTCLDSASDEARSEGCMQNVAGSIAPFVSIYARGRLHGRNHEIRVVEMRCEDPIETMRTGQSIDQVHVGPDKSERAPSHGPLGEKLDLGSVGTLVVDVPKQSQCDHLIWCTVKQPQEKQLYSALERFCGTSAARMIADWANKRPSTKIRKTKLIAA